MRRPGERSRPERGDVGRLPRGLQASRVPLERLEVGQQVVGQQDRLGPLQVGSLAG